MAINKKNLITNLIANYLGNEQGLFLKFGQVLGAQAEWNEFTRLTKTEITRGSPPQEVIDKFETIVLSNDLGFEEVEKYHTASIGLVAKVKEKKTQNIKAIKVLLPNIEKDINEQLKKLKLIDQFSKVTKFKDWDFDIASLIQEMQKTLKKECSLESEVNNLKRYQSQISSSPYPVKVPRVDHYNHEYIQMEWIDGLHIHELKKIANATERERLAYILCQRYLDDILNHGYIHGDLNFGNIIFNQQSNENYLISFIDFGHMIEVSPKIQQAIANILLSCMNGQSIDYSIPLYQLGFDPQKIKALKPNFEELIMLFVEPFLTNQFDFNEWNLKDRIEEILGENKWWFRSSGSPEFFNMMRSISNFYRILAFLDSKVGLKRITLNMLKKYEMNLPVIEKDNLVGSVIKIEAKENFRTKLHVKLDISALGNLESYIPSNAINEINKQGVSLKKLQEKWKKEGLAPRVLLSFIYKSRDYSISII